MMKTITVLSGAGMSAESGIPTFRGLNGLWEGHDIMKVASPTGWRDNPALVLEFYNVRRRNMVNAQPNAGHLALKRLESQYKVQIVTQNVDDLHERAGSSRVLHLHGEIMKERSTSSPDLVYDLKPGQDILMGDCCDLGSQLRPHIVWFEESVPLYSDGVEWMEAADVVIVVGTSMKVYPANLLVNHARPGVPIYVVDPNKPDFLSGRDLHFIESTATEGLEKVAELLMA